MGFIHYRKIDTSEVIRRAFKVLAIDCKGLWVSGLTLEKVGRFRAGGTIVSELRANGFEVRHRVSKGLQGQRIDEYRMYSNSKYTYWRGKLAKTITAKSKPHTWPVTNTKESGYV